MRTNAKLAITGLLGALAASAMMMAPDAVVQVPTAHPEPTVYGPPTEPFPAAQARGTDAPPAAADQAELTVPAPSHRSSLPTAVAPRPRAATSSRSL